jgi:hypothetical protein
MKQTVKEQLAKGLRKAANKIDPPPMAVKKPALKRDPNSRTNRAG